MNRRAFTLVELLVAIAIFGLISLAAFANLRGGSPAQVLQQQANNLSSILRQAQVQAQTGTPDSTGKFPPGGYGVHIATCAAPTPSSPCKVTLFADQDSSLAEVPAEDVAPVGDLGAEVTIDSITSTVTGALTNPVDIIFRPPSGAICINSVCSGLGSIIITLGSKNDALPHTITHTVTINQVSGQVSS